MTSILTSPPPVPDVSASTEPERCGSDVGVVICTRDRPASLRDCVRSLRDQTRRPDEIVIVRGSAESVPADLAEAAAPVPSRVVDCFGRNIAASRNAGLAACRRDLLLFIDDDATADGTWIERMTGMLDAEPSCWAAGSEVLDARQQPPRREFSRGIIATSGRQDPVRDRDAAPRGTFPIVKGCGFGIRRQPILALSGFDEAYAFAFEEADLAVRIARAGGRVRHVSDAVVRHHHVPGLYRMTDPLDRDWEVELRSHAHFCGRHARGADRLRARIVIELRLWRLRGRLEAARRQGRIDGETVRARHAAAVRGARAGRRPPQFEGARPEAAR